MHHSEHQNSTTCVYANIHILGLLVRAAHGTYALCTIVSSSRLRHSWRHTHHTTDAWSLCRMPHRRAMPHAALQRSVTPVASPVHGSTAAGLCSCQSLCPGQHLLAWGWAHTCNRQRAHNHQERAYLAERRQQRQEYVIVRKVAVNEWVHIHAVYSVLPIQAIWQLHLPL